MSTSLRSFGVELVDHLEKRVELDQEAAEGGVESEAPGEYDRGDGVRRCLQSRDHVERRRDDDGACGAAAVPEVMRDNQRPDLTVHVPPTLLSATPRPASRRHVMA